MKERYKKNVIFLGLTSLFTDMATEMIYPLLPGFFFTVLGLNRSFIGLIEGLAESSSSFFKLLSGWFSDRVKKRKVLVSIGYALSTFTKPLFGIVHCGGEALSVRFLDRAGKGIRTAPRDALISLSSPEEERGKLFGIHRALDTSGAILGPLVAFSLLPLFRDNPRPIFLLSLIPGVIALTILLSLVKEIPLNLKVNAKPSNPKDPIPSSFYYFLVVMFFFSLGNSSDAFLLLRAKEVGLSARVIPLLWMGFNISYVLLSIPAGVLSDRWGRKRVIQFSFLLYSLIYLGFALVKQVPYLWWLMLTYGCFYGLSNGNLRAFIGDLIHEDQLATAYGIYHTLTGITLLLSSLIMGILWDRWGAKPAFLFGSLLGGISFLLLVFKRKL